MTLFFDKFFNEFFIFEPLRALGSEYLRSCYRSKGRVERSFGRSVGGIVEEALEEASKEVSDEASGEAS